MLKYATLSLMFVSVMALKSLDVSNYEYVREKKNWYQANEYCKKNGMELLEINTDQEYDLIVKSKENSSIHCLWTSGNDLGEEGTWVWLSSGEKIINTHWTDGNPDDFLESEDCLELRSDNSYFNDADCNKLCNFMCEKKSKLYLQIPSDLVIDVPTA